MTESEFEALTERALQDIDRAVSESGIDADIQMKGAGVLEIEFPDTSKIIVNRHSAAREIWVAARSGGFHFHWDGAVWRDTRSGEELLAGLSRLVASQGGAAVGS